MDRSIHNQTSTSCQNLCGACAQFLQTQIDFLDFNLVKSHSCSWSELRLELKTSDTASLPVHRHHHTSIKILLVISLSDITWEVPVHMHLLVIKFRPWPKHTKVTLVSFMRHAHRLGLMRSLKRGDIRKGLGK